MSAFTLRAEPAPVLLVFQGTFGHLGPEAQGVEGRKVHEAAEKVCRHWCDRAEYKLAAEDSSDAFGYDSLPLKPAFRVRVKYQYVGELKPLHYSLDE